MIKIKKLRLRLKFKNPGCIYKAGFPGQDTRFTIQSSKVRIQHAEVRRWRVVIMPEMAGRMAGWKEMICRNQD